MIINIINSLDKITENLHKQGKTEEEIRNAIKVYLREKKKRVVTII